MKGLKSLVLAFAVAACGQRVTVNGVKSELSANLPVGSTTQAVADYVNKRGFSSDGPVSVRELDYVDGRKDRYVLRSIIRNVRRSVFVTTDISMTFTFDGSERLQSIKVAEVHTGL
jgi:hypothetical protein